MHEFEFTELNFAIDKISLRQKFIHPSSSTLGRLARSPRLSISCSLHMLTNLPHARSPLLQVYEFSTFHCAHPSSHRYMHLYRACADCMARAHTSFASWDIKCIMYSQLTLTAITVSARARSPMAICLCFFFLPHRVPRVLPVRYSRACLFVLNRGEIDWHSLRIKTCVRTYLRTHTHTRSSVESEKTNVY